MGCVVLPYVFYIRSYLFLSQHYLELFLIYFLGFTSLSNSASNRQIPSRLFRNLESRCRVFAAYALVVRQYKSHHYQTNALRRLQDTNCAFYPLHSQKLFQSLLTFLFLFRQCFLLCCLSQYPAPLS